MKYALVKGIKTEAIKGERGTCPSCKSELIAKCGKVKINHWSHKGMLNCDIWWENETEWHRQWKDQFPKEWEEMVLFDSKGEKHIADIMTNLRITIEFQHSHINPDERLSREKFYKNLIWVVDGTRLKRDYPRFIKGKDSFQIVKKGVFKVNFPDEYFPSAWLDSSAPVVFDFLGINGAPELNDNLRKTLYCLFPIKIGGSAIIAEIQRIVFVNSIINGNWSGRVQQFMNDLIQVKKEHQSKIEREQKQRTNIIFQNSIERKQYRAQRRF